MSKGPLTAADYAAAAWWLDCEVAVIQAVAEVEAGPWGAWRPNGEPTILFERHLLHRFTGGKWSRSHPDISNPSPGGYGRVSEQHGRLARAAALDRDAALRSASWGLFQVLGDNWRLCGYLSLQDFVNEAYRSTSAHLRMFCRYIMAVPGLQTALKARDWHTVARLYNGPTYAKSNYHGRMADAYERISQA